MEGVGVGVQVYIRIKYIIHNIKLTGIIIFMLFRIKGQYNHYNNYYNNFNAPYCIILIKLT